MISWMQFTSCPSSEAFSNVSDSSADEKKEDFMGVAANGAVSRVQVRDISKSVNPYININPSLKKKITTIVKADCDEDF